MRVCMSAYVYECEEMMFLSTRRNEAKKGASEIDFFRTQTCIFSSLPHNPIVISLCSLSSKSD